MSSMAIKADKVDKDSSCSLWSVHINEKVGDRMESSYRRAEWHTAV